MMNCMVPYYDSPCNLFPDSAHSLLRNTEEKTCSLHHSKLGQTVRQMAQKGTAR